MPRVPEFKRCQSLKGANDVRGQKVPRVSEFKRCKGCQGIKGSKGQSGSKAHKVYLGAGSSQELISDRA